MKSEFKPRPESKHLKASGRPISRYINTEQAMTTFEQGKKEQSQDHFQKAIELYIKATMYDPNLFQAFCNIGSCYRSLKQYSESKKFYLKSISINRGDAISHYNLANVLRLMGDFQTSIEHYSFVIGLKEEQSKEIGRLYLDSLINLGICYKNKGFYEKAEQCYQKVLKIDPQDQVSLFNYAMTTVSNLAQISQDVFQDVTKEQAQKVLSILNRYLLINKTNPMVNFQLLRMSVILDHSEDNVNKVMEQLKQMIKAPGCTLADEINLELGQCLKLLKKYEASASHYKKSLTNFHSKKSNDKTTNQYDLPNDSIIAPEPSKRGNITEEEGVKLIEEGKFQEVEERISELEETSTFKHVLELALALSMVDQSEEHLKRAQKIYQTYLKKGEEEMDKISVEGHKAIGQLLSLQGNFKESIKHFQFVSKMLTSEEDKSKIYNNLGNDYEALGDLSKALEQYKIALKSQPDSYEAHFNVGCCFYEEGSFGEAMGYFQKFMKLIKGNFDLSSETKNLYIADCFIMMAACKSEEEVNKLNCFDIYLEARNAVKDVLEQPGSRFQFEDKKILSFYLQWSQILEQKLSGLPPKGEEYLRCKQMLLEAYICLLENKNCPDKDAILSNCGTIYNQEKQYANALANFMQIESEEKIAPNNIALTYLHLHQHYMATNYIFKAAYDSFDVVEKMNKEIICWIYGLEEEQNQQLNHKFKNRCEEAMIFRLQYGKMILDAVTSQINLLSSTSTTELSEIKDIYEKVITSDNLYQYYEEAEHPKLRALTLSLRENKSKVEDHVDLSLLAGLLKPSNNVEEDFNALVKRCADSGKDMSQTVTEVYLNLFVFSNREHVSTIRAATHKLTAQHRQSVSLKLDRRVTVTPDFLCRSFGKEHLIKSIQDLVAHLVNWESEIEMKTTVLLKLIEKFYYKSNIKRPLQYEYNFPRHTVWKQDSPTLLKIASVILHMIKMPSLTLKGKSLTEMKHSIYVQLQRELMKKIEKKEEVKLTLGEKMVPLTVYGFFQSRLDCLQFLKELQRESSAKGNIDVGRDCKELVVNVSGVVCLVCQWEETHPVMLMLRSLSQHQLPMDAQSVICLEEDLVILQESSEEAKELIQGVPLLRS